MPFPQPAPGVPAGTGKPRRCRSCSAQLIDLTAPFVFCPICDGWLGKIKNG